MADARISIVIAQLNPVIGDFAHNAARLIEAMRAHPEAHLVVGAELGLAGYHPGDLLEEPDFLDRQDEALRELLAASAASRATVLVGAATRNLAPGKPLHNSLLALRRGRIETLCHKQLLPTYGVFDDARHFEPGPRLPSVIEVAGYRVGLLICEDAWNDEAHGYTLNPVADMAALGIDLLVCANASPSHLGKQAERHRLFAHIADKYRLPALYVNQVGGNDQIVYDGASFAVEPAAGVVWEAARFAEEVAAIHFADGHFAPRRRLPATCRAAFYEGQLLLGLRDYVAKTGFKEVVVASSGGIDSALTLALAVRALGPDRVAAITMPSRVSTTGSVTDSQDLCARLQVRLHTIPIVDMVQACHSGFAAGTGVGISGLAAENLQARIRGTLIMSFSNQFGHLVVSTGNKSEMSVGYATLYGDMCGGLALIGDLYKTEVYLLARHINGEYGALIPDAILDKEPSAELAEGQRDSDSLPPYPLLDEILKWHIEGHRLDAEEFAAAASVVANLRAVGQVDTVARVLAMVSRSEYKRRQAPPIIRVRPRAFGSGRQLPIAARYPAADKPRGAAARHSP